MLVTADGSAKPRDFGIAKQRESPHRGEMVGRRLAAVDAIKRR
jgi:hypothetical protein